MPDLEFHGQKEGEKVIFAIKQNLVVLLPSLLKITTLWLVEILLFKFSFYISWSGYSYLVSMGLYIVIIWTIYILVTFWYCWTNTIYLLTNERVMSVDQKGWFNRIISEAILENILFISHKVQGPLQTLLNFGSIHIRASGVIEEEIVLKNISDPYEVQQEIVTKQRKITGKEATVKDEGENKDFWKESQKNKKPLIR